MKIEIETTLQLEDIGNSGFLLGQCEKVKITDEELSSNWEINNRHIVQREDKWIIELELERTEK